VLHPKGQNALSLRRPCRQRLAQNIPHQALENVLSKAVILQTAQDTQFCQRQQTLDPVHLLDTILEVLACQKKVDVSLLHRYYLKVAGLFRRNR
jgi:hypothetical protein